MTTAATEAATTSAPEPYLSPGRPDRAGAARAWSEELFARHGRMVAGLCRLLVRDAAEAEDAAQQTFLSAHRALLNGSVPREPAPWLATIARNECRARARARMREPLLLGDTEPAATASDALSEAIRRADLAALWRAIDTLPLPQRDALLLREFGGLSYEELASALAVSESAVESLLFRARRGLRERLSEAYAGVAGAGWLEALGRLFAGGSGVAAPVAAKAVAVGVGAAVVAGGVVVAPDMLQHRGPARPAQAHVQPLVRRHAQSVGDFLPTGQPPSERRAAATPARPTAQPVVFAVPPSRARASGGESESDDAGGTPVARGSVPSGEDERGGGGDAAVTTGREGGDRASADSQTPSAGGDGSSSDGSGDQAGSGDAPAAPAVQGDGSGDGAEGAGGGNGGGDG